MQILDPSRYELVKPMVESVPFNTLFAQIITQRVVKGTIYVDSVGQPGSALVWHPYGMLLLCGRADNAAFNREITEFMLDSYHPRDRWLQVYPEEWSHNLKALLSRRLTSYPSDIPHDQAERLFREMNRENVVECRRLNFAFNLERYLKSTRPSLPDGISVRPVDRPLYEEMPGNVIARYFWNTFNDFCARGTGFCLLKEETVLSSCCTAFAKDTLSEIGIETSPRYRGQGWAGLTARCYIDYCLEKRLEPVWACRKENLGSLKLAQNLGFQIVREHPYYCLANNNP